MGQSEPVPTWEPRIVDWGWGTGENLEGIPKLASTWILKVDQ